ncbi:MAG: reverse transcriptase/maturase family protein [Thermomicrobiales bacterium]
MTSRDASTTSTTRSCCQSSPKASATAASCASEGTARGRIPQDWKYNKTLSGTPQGGVVSPILANIYLDRLDKYVAGTLIPQHTRGERRKPNREYARKKEKARYLGKTGRREEAAVLWKEVRNMPSIQTDDPEYRRLRYVRYADDFLLGFIGTHEEAQNIKAQLAAMLQNSLKLDLSEEKTLVTHARTGQARFLGYNVSIATDDTRGMQEADTSMVSSPSAFRRKSCKKRAGGTCPTENQYTARNGSTMKSSKS